MALLHSQAEKDVLAARSSFMSVEKILEQIVQRMLVNERLKRLLYYTDKHALKLPKLTQEQSHSLINTSILIVPQLKIDPDAKPYVIISLSDFTPMPGQTTFKNITLTFDIFCNFDHWVLENFKLRPHAIAGEIDGMINSSFINTGVAKLNGARQLFLNEWLGGISVDYNVETYLDDYAAQGQGNK